MTERTKFDLWVEYEKIAMHFNELLMQLRLRALAGVGAIGSIVGFIANDENGFDWGLVACVSFVLLLVWIAIWVIDKFYYARLLEGAVAEIIELEKNVEVEGVKINMSTRIEQLINGNTSSKKLNSSVTWFYIIIVVLLFFSLVVSLFSAKMLAM